MASRLPEQTQLGYQHTLMYGHYSKALGDFAKQEARRVKSLKKKGKDDVVQIKEAQRRNGNKLYKVKSALGWLWRHTCAKLGEDWIFLALLGIIMAPISFFLDYAVAVLFHARIWLYELSAVHPAAQYFAWIVLPILLILFSAGFVHLVAPQAIGSGVPEVKTILRGVALEECLTFRTLVAKLIGLTATLGSGIPLGKEAPFVHIASIVANLLSKLMTTFQGIYENQSRKTDMLAAACAVGLSSCFGSPVGGVLYSIEVTSVYFAVRNYWRGFFSAVCCAIVFRLLAVWIEHEATLTALFGTSFTAFITFDLQELFAFAFIGVMCGLGGAAYVWLHRQYVFLMRRSKVLTSFLQKNRFLYPAIVAVTFSSVSFPLGLGQFMASDLDTHDKVVHLFSNFTWTKTDLTVEEADVVRHWSTEYTNVFVSLSGFTAFTFVFSIIGATVPIPSGNFIPVFMIGAGLGRIVGELMHLWFPFGLGYAGLQIPIIPGGYATVGAAAFVGAVTHSISVAVIVFEMTGQLTHFMPIIIAVLISNAIAALLQPSLYESMILIKKLPYLPVLLPYSSGLYSVYVDAFMVRDVKYIWRNMSYQSLKDILKNNRDVRGFPLVDNPGSMILLGSVQRFELIKLIERHIGRERRLQVAAQWHKRAQKRAREDLERKIWERLQRKFQPQHRFEVLPADMTLKRRLHSTNELVSPSRLAMESGPSFIPSSQGGQPKKSILKNPNTLPLRRATSMVSPATPFPTALGSDSRIRLAFDSLFRKAATMPEVHDPEIGELIEELSEIPSPSQTSKKVQLPHERVIDMTSNEQREWEAHEMMKSVNFDHCPVDPAPFQLVEKTSLMKVHSLFSLVGVNHAYVTAIGRLIGVVGLKELRKAIEDSNSGNLPTVPSTSGVNETETFDDAQLSDDSLLGNSVTSESDSSSHSSGSMELEQDDDNQPDPQPQPQPQLQLQLQEATQKDPPPP